MLPVNIVVNAVYYRVCADMAEIARVAGKADEADAYTRRAEQVRAAINAKLWDATNRRYLDGMKTNGTLATHSSLHANAFALAMGLVPADRVADTVAFVKTRGLQCNMFLAMFLFEALYDNGAADYAAGLLTAPGLDSPMNAVRKGATTTWEAWDLDQKANASLFHPAGAFTAYIIASRIMGVVPTKPGFAEFTVAPHFGALKSASVRVPTPHGAIELAYKQEGKRAVINITVPVGTSANVVISAPSIQVDGRAAKNAPSITLTAGTHKLQY